MENYIWVTPEEITIEISKHLRNIRKRKNISQIELSKLSNVSLGSIKRFETSGDISLISLTKLAMALSVENELKELFRKVPYISIQEVINENR